MSQNSVTIIIPGDHIRVYYNEGETAGQLVERLDLKDPATGEPLDFFYIQGQIVENWRGFKLFPDMRLICGPEKKANVISPAKAYEYLQHVKRDLGLTVDFYAEQMKKGAWKMGAKPSPNVRAVKLLIPGHKPLEVAIFPNERFWNLFARISHTLYRRRGALLWYHQSKRVPTVAKDGPTLEHGDILAVMAKPGAADPDISELIVEFVERVKRLSADLPKPSVSSPEKKKASYPVIKFLAEGAPPRDMPIISGEGLDNLLSRLSKGMYKNRQLFRFYVNGISVLDLNSYHSPKLTFGDVLCVRRTSSEAVAQEYLLEALDTIDKRYGSKSKTVNIKIIVTGSAPKTLAACEEWTVADVAKNISCALGIDCELRNITGWYVSRDGQAIPLDDPASFKLQEGDLLLGTPRVDC